MLIAHYFMWHTGHPAPEHAKAAPGSHRRSESCPIFIPATSIHSRDVTFAVFCRGPHEESARCRDFMGWELPWYSAQGWLDRRVVWHVLDNYFKFIQDGTEWTGADVVFEIAKKGDKTDVRFTPVGLVPAYGCYDVCSNAWGGYISGSLRSLIAMGKESPTSKKADGWSPELTSESIGTANHANAQTA